MQNRSILVSTAAGLVLAVTAACASHRADATPRVTDRDQTAKGAGVGAYMDAQEERLARIPGTHVERVDKEALLVRFDSDILFRPDSARLGPAARGTVEEVASVLSQYRKTAVEVQGHTDATGPASHNQYLSRRRAETVGSVLVASGVAPQRVVATGYGERMPVASNSSERGRQLNRRVEILLKARAS